MKNILDERESLYRFYKNYYRKHCNIPKKQVYDEFKIVILSKYGLMPYFFVEELKRRGYDISDDMNEF